MALTAQQRTVLTKALARKKKDTSGGRAYQEFKDDPGANLDPSVLNGQRQARPLPNSNGKVKPRPIPNARRNRPAGNQTFKPNMNA